MLAMTLLLPSLINTQHSLIPNTCSYGSSFCHHPQISPIDTRSLSVCPGKLCEDEQICPSQVFVGAGKLSRSVDVYAFGVLLWEMYTGQRPWSGLSPMQIIFHITIRKKRLQFPADTPTQLQVWPGSWIIVLLHAAFACGAECIESHTLCCRHKRLIRHLRLYNQYCCGR